MNDGLSSYTSIWGIEVICQTICEQSSKFIFHHYKNRLCSQLKGMARGRSQVESKLIGHNGSKMFDILVTVVNFCIKSQLDQAVLETGPWQLRDNQTHNEILNELITPVMPMRCLTSYHAYRGWCCHDVIDVIYLFALLYFPSYVKPPIPLKRGLVLIWGCWTQVEVWYAFFLSVLSSWGHWTQVW